MKTWKLWLIASDRGVSSQVVSFDSLEEAESAHQAITETDYDQDAPTYTQLKAIRLYPAPLDSEDLSWEKM